ncbi:MAG: hypothetical protein JSV39_04465 [Candidatus Aenigmatarchaeota archaeon]|nr:MAG: hypothetical protein JSV39_04465 [Candidatus Aenigmarchaeota archaeon]
MKIPLGGLVKFNELAAWQSRLPKRKRYTPPELVSIYNTPIEVNSTAKNYLEIPPKKGKLQI